MRQIELLSDASPLSESAFRPDGTFPVRIIAEGWGSSGFYSKQKLIEAAHLYAKNTRMFINHPTRSELKERPERDLNQLAAYFINEKAVWNDNGIFGPGLYQEAKALPNYVDFLREAAPAIGVSHFVLGKTRNGEAAGRSGPIVESIDQVISVDLVTSPGAKGSIGAMYESWIDRETTMAEPETKTVLKETWDDLRERQTLAESQNRELLKENGDLKNQVAAKDTEIASLKESMAKAQEKLILYEAGIYANELVEKAELPELAKTRIKESLIRQAAAKDGSLDRDAFRNLAEAAIKSEQEYLGTITKTGSVRGMGGSGTPAGINLEESKKYLYESYRRSGMSEDAAKKAVGGMS